VASVSKLLEIDSHEMECMNQKNTPAGLAQVAGGRDHISTDEFASAFNRKGQTVRKNFCLTGECFGVRPIKLYGRLLWPVDAVAASLRGEVPQ
jgi:hypothetical protein